VLPASDLVTQLEGPVVQAESVAEQSAPPKFTEATKTASYSKTNHSKEQPVLMPLVFQTVDLSQLDLNARQLQAIDDLRQRFLDEIGGPHQDLTDPGYRERWKKSQPELDNDLRGMIGFAAFQNYQVEAARQ